MLLSSPVVREDFYLDSHFSLTLITQGEMVARVRDCNFFTDSTPNKPKSCAATRGTVGWGACCSYFLVRKDIAFIWVHIALYSYIKWLHSAEFTVKTQPGNVGKVKIVKPSWGKVGTQTNSLQRNCNNTWQWWTPAHSPCGTMSRTSPLFVLTTKTYLLIFFKKLHNLASAETDLQDFFSVPCFQHCAAVLSHWCT